MILLEDANGMYGQPLHECPIESILLIAAWPHREAFAE